MMNKPPKVSIILPFFNAKDTLLHAIKSIESQSFIDWELLLVDNNSTDGSTEIARASTKRDRRITYFSESMQGVVFAANLGFQKSIGSYLARMDADDFSYPDRIAKQVELLDTKLDVGLVSGFVKYVGDDANGGFIRYVEWLNSVNSAREITLNQFAEYPIPNPSVMLRRELVGKYGGFKEGNFPEDYEFFLRLQEHGVQMEKVEQIILDWADSPSRLTRTDGRYSHDSFFKLKAKYLAKWLKTNNSFYPDVWIWGGGKLAKRRSEFLKEYGINIIAHIDVIVGGSNVHYSNVDVYRDGFVLSYVTSWGARQQVRDYLDRNGFIEGDNYLICG